MRIIIAALLLGLATVARAQNPAGPRNLALEVTVLRFKPESKEQVLENFKFTGGITNAIESLRAVGRTVDILYRGTRGLALEEKALAKFDATETRPVILVGKPGAPMPPATVYGLTLQIAAKPTGPDTFVLAWEGSLTWSPELMDRRSGFQNSLSFIGRAATVAQGASQLAGESQGTVKQAADIGLAVAELFKERTTDNSIYELPVLKTVSLNGSRNCRNDELVTTTTAAEAGVKEPQVILFLVHPRLEP